MAAEDLVIETLQDRVLTLLINRPASNNALNSELNLRLHHAIASAARRDEVGAVVLTGAGRNFCVGGDMKVLSGPREPDAGAGGLDQALQRGGEMCLTLHQMGKPTFAMIRGAAAGGGLGLALGCDFRFADETAKFAYAYTRIALSGDFSTNYLLQKWLGPARARTFALCSEIVDAPEAERIGLISRCIASASLEAETYRLARDLANGPTAVLGRIKANLDACWEKAPDGALAVESCNFKLCSDSPDHREAVGAFVEQRPPRFHGV
ncbi:MAG: enoyl-CoA hydratase/isomerase family protein [Caulobacteraceae bacterium]|nr:enoyl-CoA hydratase/isomerase family protein [Caulobacteraceae bacterium]